MFTKYSDMHSGGYRKTEYDVIYIEAERELADEIFYNRFGHSPNAVACSCCGENFWSTEVDEIELDMNEATLVIRMKEIIADNLARPARGVI